MNRIKFWRFIYEKFTSEEGLHRSFCFIQNKKTNKMICYGILPTPGKEPVN